MEALDTKREGRRAEKKTGVKVHEKEEGSEQVVKPIFIKGSSKEIYIDNTKPGAMSFNLYAKGLHLIRGVGGERDSERGKRGADRDEKFSAAAAIPARRVRIHAWNRKG